MEVAVQVINIAYYHSSKAAYISAEVLEKRITDKQHPNIHHFQTAQKGERINLKCANKSYSELFEVLENRILKFTVSSIELPKDCKQGFKFIFDSVEPCAILVGN